MKKNIFLMMLSVLLIQKSKANIKNNHHNHLIEKNDYPLPRDILFPQGADLNSVYTDQQKK